MIGSSNWGLEELRGMMITRVSAPLNQTSYGMMTAAADSAYIFVGGLHFDLTEGDVITIFSQYAPTVYFILGRGFSLEK